MTEETMNKYPSTVTGKTIEQTYANKPTTTILCPTCKIPMQVCQYSGGGIYWLCGKCGCKVERTGL